MATQADFKVKKGLVVNSTASFLSTITSTSTNSGAVQISGGAGIAKDVYVGGTINLANATSATGTASGALQVLGGVGIGGNLYAANIYSNGILLGGNALTATTATNLANGAAGSIPYQSAVSATTFLAIGTNGFVLTSNGSAPVWTGIGSLAAGIATTANNILTVQQTVAGTYYPTFVDANNVTATGEALYTTSSFSINPASGSVTLNNGLVLGSTAQNPILMTGSYSQPIPGFIVANGTLVGNTTTTQIYAFNYQHNLAPVTTATISSYYGQLFLPTLSNTATYGSMYGAFARIDMTAAATSGTVGTWIGFTSDAPNKNAAADVRFINHFGFRAQDPSSITATNVYGYNSQIALSAGVNKWNIYSSGTAPNYFAGSVGVGTTSFGTGEKLSVIGGANITGITTVTNTLNAANVNVTNPGTVSVPSLTFGSNNRGIYNPSGGDLGFVANGYLQLYIAGTNPAVNYLQVSGGATGTPVILSATGTDSIVNLTLAPKNNGTVIVASTSATNSTITGALQVAGGVGISGGLFVGGVVTATNLTLNAVRGDNSSSGTQYVVFYNIATKELTTSTAAGVSSTGTTGTFLIANSTPTSSTATGALVVQGGVGIWGGMNIGGITTVTNITAATSTASGAFQVNGGVGIGGNLYAGNIYTNGSQVTPTSIQEFTATVGQTTFTIAGGYTVGQIQVFANGIQLGTGDYTASNASTVVLGIGRNVGDIVRVVVSQNYVISAQQAYTFNQYTALGGQTTFATSYNTATVQVFANGALVSPTAYTANNGTSIVFGSGRTIGDIIAVVSFNSVSIANAISSSGGTINGTLNVVGSLQQNGVDVNNRAIAMSIAMSM